jgi:hypothetical protein
MQEILESEENIIEEEEDSEDSSILFVTFYKDTCIKSWIIVEIFFLVSEILLLVPPLSFSTRFPKIV